MSDLEKNLSNFKKKLNERNILTEDDITELETHIIDKVDDLKQNGLNENDAFNKAVSDLGSINEITAEYSKVNLSNDVKFMLLCFGYVAITFLLSIIYFISISLSYFTQNIESTFDYNYTDPLESLYNGNPDYPVLCILLVNVALVLLLLYLIIKKHNNLLSLISNKILLIHNSKPAIKFVVSFLVVFMPILINTLISLMFNQLSHTMTFSALQNDRNCIFVNLILLLSLIVRYMKSKISNNASAYMILGYLIITVVIRLIPSLILNISIVMNQYNIICISILFITFVIITCYLIRLLSKKRILEDKPSIILSSILLVVFIGSSFIHPSIASFDYAQLNDCMSNFSVLSSAAQLCLNLLTAAAIFSGYRIPFSRKRSIG